MSHPLEHKPYECNECHRFVSKLRNGLCFPCSEGAEPPHFHVCRRCTYGRAPSANGLCVRCAGITEPVNKSKGEMTYKQLISVREELAKLAVPMGTIPVSPIIYRSAECLRCDSVIPYGINDSEVKCPECKTKYYIGIDAEFVDGMWKDLTKLTRA